MYNNKKILGLVPARGGSKGIPRKNIRSLRGKPLINYTIEAGLNSQYIDYLMVSTDDDEIAYVAKEAGAEIPFMRPDYLATDTSKTIDVVINTLDMLKDMGQTYDILVLLQPTQPLRTQQDIDGAIETFFEYKCESLVSVSKVDDHPILMRIISDNKLVPLLNQNSTCRRQDMPDYYRVNGCIYINRISLINEDTSFNDNVIPFIMEESHSVDIDEEKDLILAKHYLDLRENAVLEVNYSHEEHDK